MSNADPVAVEPEISIDPKIVVAQDFWKTLLALTGDEVTYKTHISQRPVSPRNPYTTRISATLGNERTVRRMVALIGIINSMVPLNERIGLPYPMLEGKDSIDIDLGADALSTINKLQIHGSQLVSVIREVNASTEKGATVTNGWPLHL